MVPFQSFWGNEIKQDLYKIFFRDLMENPLNNIRLLKLPSQGFGNIL